MCIGAGCVRAILYTFGSPSGLQLTQFIPSQPSALKLRGQGQIFPTWHWTGDTCHLRTPFSWGCWGHPLNDLSRKCGHPCTKVPSPPSGNGWSNVPSRTGCESPKFHSQGHFWFRSTGMEAAQDCLWQPGFLGCPGLLERPQLKQKQQQQQSIVSHLWNYLKYLAIFFYVVYSMSVG